MVHDILIQGSYSAADPENEELLYIAQSVIYHVCILCEAELRTQSYYITCVKLAVRST